MNSPDRTRCTGHDPHENQCELPFGHPPPCSPYRKARMVDDLAARVEQLEKRIAQLEECSVGGDR